MRSIDLHALRYDCLKDDPDDPAFKLLSFYQSKTKSWNTKPLQVDDGAHLAVIHSIEEQRSDILRQWGHQTEFLFPVQIGDAVKCMDRNYTKNVISQFVLKKAIRDKTGGIYHFGWHDFRHYYGTELALSGYDLHLIMLELGHVSPDMTLVYINKRLKLRKKALAEKGGGKYLDIRGGIDDKFGELLLRKDAMLSVDVPGGLCSMPAQIGEWCEHNRACFTCSFFRADINQAAFFEAEKRTMIDMAQRLRGEVDNLKSEGKARLSEIGAARLDRAERGIANVGTILRAIKTEGTYRGGIRKYQRTSSIGSEEGDCEASRCRRGPPGDA